MNPEDMKALLESVEGFAEKVTWFEWPIGGSPPLPFVCYFTVKETSFAADNVNYYIRPIYAVELYSRTRDLAVESLFGNAFAAAGLYYSKDAEYLAEAECWVTVFTI